MDIRRERLPACINDLDKLLLDYFERTNAQEGQPKLDMNWAQLMGLDDRGHLCIFTARDNGRLRGFGMYVMMKHLHHATTKWAMCDILAVDPDVRGTGVATQIVEHAAKKLKHMNVDYMVHGYRTIYDVKPLFPKLGFTLIEHSYMKAL